MGKKQDIARRSIQDMDHSKTPEFKVEGPWAFRGLNEMVTPLFRFLPGGEKQEIGEVVATTEKGLLFEISLKEGFEDIETASFEVPMRFHVKRKDAL